MCLDNLNLVKATNTHVLIEIPFQSISLHFLFIISSHDMVL